MRTFAFVFGLVSLSALATSELPVCINLGTRSEGWAYDGKFLRYDNCARKHLECVNAGKENEGWAAYDRAENEFLGNFPCSTRPSEKPVCIFVGTRSEGWDFGGKLKYSNCSKKAVECANVGSSSEGWMAFEKRNHVFLTRADCSDE